MSGPVVTCPLPGLYTLQRDWCSITGALQTSFERYFGCSSVPDVLDPAFGLALREFR